MSMSEEVTVRGNRKVAEHGTVNRYVGTTHKAKGKTPPCRCDQCRAAYSAYRKAKRTPKLKREADHGTTQCYNRGCSCETCLAAHRQYRRELRKKNAPIDKQFDFTYGGLL